MERLPVEYNLLMEITVVRKAYRFRLEPSAPQREQLERCAGARRFVWNWALATWKAYYAAHGRSIPARELSALLTVLKHRPEAAWLQEMDSQALQQTLADLHRAFAGFFAHRARYPRFKSKKRDTARFRIPQRVRLVGGCVAVPKIGAIRARLSRAVEGSIKGATFSRDACGHWFVSLCVEGALPVVPPSLPHSAAVVGLDLGLKDAVVLCACQPPHGEQGVTTQESHGFKPCGVSISRQEHQEGRWAISLSRGSSGTSGRLGWS